MNFISKLLNEYEAAGSPEMRAFLREQLSRAGFEADILEKTLGAIVQTIEVNNANYREFRQGRAAGLSENQCADRLMQKALDAASEAMQKAGKGTISQDDRAKIKQTILAQMSGVNSVMFRELSGNNNVFTQYAEDLMAPIGDYTIVATTVGADDGIDTEVAKVTEENNASIKALIQRYLDEDLGSKTESDMKTLVAAAIEIAIKTGTLPENLKVLTGKDITANHRVQIVDSGLTRAKIAWQIKTGKLDAAKGTELLREHEAAQQIPMLTADGIFRVLGTVLGGVGVPLVTGVLVAALHGIPLVGGFAAFLISPVTAILMGPVGVIGGLVLGHMVGKFGGKAFAEIKEGCKQMFNTVKALTPKVIAVSRFAFQTLFAAGKASVSFLKRIVPVFGQKVREIASKFMGTKDTVAEPTETHVRETVKREQAKA
jgi:hypothetical protein